MDFAWDGSDLGVVSESAIIGKTIIPPQTYLSIQIQDKVLMGEVRNGRSLVPVVIDELKPLFGLPKTGTHRITVGKRVYIILRTGQDHGVIVDDRSIKKPTDLTDPLLLNQVRQFIIFRDYLGLTGPPRIGLRSYDGVYVVVSRLETRHRIERTHTMMSRATIRTWFGTVDNVKRYRRVLLETLARRLDRNSVVVNESLFHRYVDGIIDRIDRNLISLTGSLVHRLHDLPVEDPDEV